MFWFFFNGQKSLIAAKDKSDLSLLERSPVDSNIIIKTYRFYSNCCDQDKHPIFYNHFTTEVFPNNPCYKSFDARLKEKEI